MRSSPLPPPPAAVGVPELALTARAAAFAEVSRLLQHPEHLRRLPQLLAEYEAKRKVKEESIDSSIANQNSFFFLPFVRFLPLHPDLFPLSHFIIIIIIIIIIVWLFFPASTAIQANAARLSSAVGAQVDAARATTALLAAASSSVARLRECYRVSFFSSCFRVFFFARLCFARSTISSRPAAGLVHAVP